MLSRQSMQLGPRAMHIGPQCSRLASNCSRPAKSSSPLQTQSRIDSSFFRPSLSRTTTRARADRDTVRRTRARYTGANTNLPYWAIIGAALALYHADLYTGSSASAFNILFGLNSPSFSIRLDSPRNDISGPVLRSNQLPSGSSQVVVDPDTQQSFPMHLAAPLTQLPGGKLKLVGVGVRTVSFLRVKVYSAGLYIDESKLDSVLAKGGLGADQSLEQMVKTLLDEGTAAVIRIVPVRNTDFNHLRDGFIRALQGRLKKAVKDGSLQPSSAAEKNFEESIQQIKESFPRGSVPRGAPLDMVIAPGRSARQAATLSFEYDGQIFGQVKSDSTTSSESTDAKFSAARELVLAYFADKGEISPVFKKSVQRGLSR